MSAFAAARREQRFANIACLLSRTLLPGVSASEQTK